MEQLSEKVCEIVAKELGIPVNLVRPDSQVEADLGIDSLAAVRIGVEIEHQFGIEMPEIPDVQTVQGLIDLVQELRSNSDSGIG
jgi:acyl carrier protein